MHRLYLMIASISGAITVALGAFGAHGLKQIASAETIGIFQTGVQYQMYHTLALLAVAIISERYQHRFMKWAGFCFITGIILFSGSLYALTALKTNGTVGLSGIGIVTPIGGLFFIAAWLFMFVAVSKKK